MNLPELLTHFNDPKPGGSGYQVRCPAHEDRVASLSISNGGGKILMHCHAGCSTEAIVAAVGLKMSDLFCEPKPQPAPGDKPKNYKGSPVIACYEYSDADGNVSYRVLKTANKDFAQQRLDDSGKWIWKGPEKKLLYRLPDLLADDSDQSVFITEGEKDVDNLRRIGLLATCNSGGAGKFTQDNSALKGRVVVILPDNDDPGRRHAADVAKKLEGIAEKIITLELPDLPAKGDVSDWIAAGGTKDELLGLVDAAINPPKEAEYFQPSDTLLRPDELSLMGLAALFHRQYYKDTRFVEARGAFFNYTKGVWTASRCLAEVKTKDIINQVHEKAKETEARLEELTKKRDELLTGGKAEEAQPISRELGRLHTYLDALEKFLPKIKRPSTMSAILDFARSDLLIGVDDFDPDHALFNVANGSIDLKTGKFRPHRSTDLCSMQSPVEYVEGADCPRWKGFLRNIFLDDQELVDFIQRAAGYSLSGYTSEQVMLILQGAGSNGKGTLFRIMETLLGTYGGSPNIDTFMDDKPAGGHNEDIARLRGCRMVMTSETEKSKRLAEALVKRLTGEDTITASYKHERTFQYRPRFKIWMAANYKPIINGADYGIWRRIFLVPFLAAFHKPQDWGRVDGVRNFKVDETLEPDLRKELSGILNWAISGYAAWEKQGLNPPKAVKDASAAYRSESDKLGTFLGEECEKEPGSNTPLSDIYERYQLWAEQSGVRATSKHTLASDLRMRGVEVRRIGKMNVTIVEGYVLIPKYGK